ncbi:hypothetical protein MASR2M78_00380 [Treponema sp.]
MIFLLRLRAPRCFPILLAVLAIASLWAEEEEPLEKPSSESLSSVPTASSSVPAVLELDIFTSNLQELASWCRSLSLSEAGTKEDLAARLRDYYQLPSPNMVGNQDEKSENRTIIVESARETEYFTRKPLTKNMPA